MKCKCGKNMSEIINSVSEMDGDNFATAFWCFDCGRVVVNYFDGSNEWHEPRNVAKPNACPQLCEVRELIKKIEEWQDVVSTFELDLMERDTVNVMTDIIRLKNSIKEKL